MLKEPLKRIAVFLSGGGSNLQALMDAEKEGRLTAGTLALVLSNRSDAYGLKRAEGAGLPALALEGQRRGDAFEAEALRLLSDYDIDLIVLAGFLRILSAHFIQACGLPILNVHPSLIPSFCGKGFYGLRVHQAALDYGVKVTGATVHYVNEIPDGGTILLQKAVDVLEGDTPLSLQKRVMEEAEWILLPRAVQAVCRQLLEEEAHE